MHLEITLLGSGIAAAMLIVGAAIAYRWAPGDRTRSALQHLAAGVICAVTAAELVPEALKTARGLDFSVGFVAGVALMLVAKALGERLSGENSRGGFLVATGLDVSIDGLLIGVAFSIGTDTGGLLVLAFTLELAALGLALGATGTRSLRHSVGTAALLALPVLPAAVVGQLVVSQLPIAFRAGLVGFATAVLLYLVIEELMSEAHEVEERPLATSLFFAGFLGLVLLQMQITD